MTTEFETIDAVDFREHPAYKAELAEQLKALGNPDNDCYVVFDIKSNNEGVTLPVVTLCTPENKKHLIGATWMNKQIPSNFWSIQKEKDPHGTFYSEERAKLAYGYMTDDTFANAMYTCDHRKSLSSIGYLTGAKERIRWLSRTMDELLHALAHSTDKNTQKLLAKIQERNRIVPRIPR